MCVQGDKRFNRFVDNELEILKFVQHRHVVALYEILETPDVSWNLFSYVCLLMFVVVVVYRTSIW